MIGDFQSNTLWEMRNDVYMEGVSPFVAERYTQYSHAGQQPMFLASLELLFDTGHGIPVEFQIDGGNIIAETGDVLIAAVGDNLIWGIEGLNEPLVDIRWSDDGGRNYCNYKERSLGKIGEYGKRVTVHRCGRFRNRLFHVRVADPCKRDWIASTGRLGIGEYN